MKNSTLEKNGIHKANDMLHYSESDFHPCSSLSMLCILIRPYRWGSVVQRHEARWRVSQHGEVGSGWGAHG